MGTVDCLRCQRVVSEHHSSASCCSRYRTQTFFVLTLLLNIQDIKQAVYTGKQHVAIYFGYCSCCQCAWGERRATYASILSDAAQFNINVNVTPSRRTFITQWNRLGGRISYFYYFKGSSYHQRLFDFHLRINSLANHVPCHKNMQVT